MTDIDDLFEGIALAHGYDPVKAREYYLRTRKLKGRKVGVAVSKTTKVSKTISAPTKSSKAQRVDKVQKKLNKALYLIERLPDSPRKAKLLARLEANQKRLYDYAEKQTLSAPKTKKKPLHTKPDKSGRLPGDPEYGNDPGYDNNGRKKVKK